MRNWLRKSLASLALAAVATGTAEAQPGAAASAEARARGAAEIYLAGWREENADKLLSVLSDDFAHSYSGAQKEEFRKQAEAAFAATDVVRNEIESVEATDSHVRVRYWAERTGGDPVRKTLFLQERDGEMRIVTAANQMTSGTVDAADGRYRSTIGGFSLPVPKGWSVMGGPSELQGVVPETVLVLAPDLKSFFLLGYVQLPMKLEPDQAAKICLEADEGATKRQAEKYTAGAPEAVTAGGLNGLRITSEFALENQTRKRIRAYFPKDKYVYFFICDAIPPDAFGGLRETFDAVIHGFSPGGTDGGGVAESPMAQGAVSGNVYQSSEFNCHIAAPRGWELDTSPNPGHLAQMQYKKGRSMARLVAGRAPADQTTRKLVDQRTRSLKEAVKDFKERKQREVRIGDADGIESVQSYSVEGLGRIVAKELTVVRNGVYYLVLCQALEPDSYRQLEPDFDSVIESFGFIQ